jgi:hypothetical protein
MSLIYKQELKNKKNLLRNQLIQAEWNCYSKLAENIRKRIKQIEQQIEEL